MWNRKFDDCSQNTYFEGYTNCNSIQITVIPTCNGPRPQQQRNVTAKVTKCQNKHEEKNENTTANANATTAKAQAKQTQTLTKTRSQQGRELGRGKKLYKNKTYQNGALTHHLRDALSQLCCHARLIQATREFAFHSRISFAFTVVAVPIVDVVVVLFTTTQGLNDAWRTSCCYCCCFCHFVCV